MESGGEVLVGRNAVLKRICKFSVRWFCQPLVLSQSFCLETKVHSKDSTNVSFLLLILNKEWRCPWVCQRGWPESAWPPSGIFDSNGLRLIMQYASPTSRCVVTCVGGLSIRNTNTNVTSHNYKSDISQIQITHHTNTNVNNIQISPTSQCMLTRVGGSRLSPHVGSQPYGWENHHGHSKPVITMTPDPNAQRIFSSPSWPQTFQEIWFLELWHKPNWIHCR